MGEAHLFNDQRRGSAVPLQSTHLRRVFNGVSILDLASAIVARQRRTTMRRPAQCLASVKALSFFIMNHIDIFQNHFKTVFPELFFLLGITIILIYGVIYSPLKEYKYPVLIRSVG